ncbi:hypothetical protein C1646_703354 [Rhizophagus diaphanus]|nr:hypothetical protein C1646_703354 [Rhizophagus diaphanus] [Rhizophagus sp. MUCL 43196]
MMISQLIKIYISYLVVPFPPYISGEIPNIANIRSSLNDQISNKANNGSSLNDQIANRNGTSFERSNQNLRSSD